MGEMIEADSSHDRGINKVEASDISSDASTGFIHIVCGKVEIERFYRIWMHCDLHFTDRDVKHP